jgi:hypothetical protein
MPMLKASTRNNSKEFVIKSKKKSTQLKNEIVNSVLNFSKSFQVETYGDCSKIEYNMN